MIRLAVFDLETTGVNPLVDRIVTAYFALLNERGEVEREQEWIVDPGVPIPEQASDVHGWTNERLNAWPQTRRDLDAVALEIGHLIYAITGDGRIPLAGHNLAYDCTMLDAHLVRAGRSPLPYGPRRGGTGINVLDSLVLDKHFNRYLKGSGQRKLTPTAARYGIELTEEQAHAANFDAIASGRITQAIIRKHLPYLAGSPDMPTSLSALHAQHVAWRAEQQIDLQKWLRDNTDPDAFCEPEWPTHYAASTERNAA